MNTGVSLIEQRLQTDPLVEISCDELSATAVAELERKGYTVTLTMDTDTGRLLFYTIERREHKTHAPPVQGPRWNLCEFIVKFALLCALITGIAFLVFFSMFSYALEMEFLVNQMQAQRTQTEMSCSVMICIACSWKSNVLAPHSQTQIHLGSQKPEEFMRAFWKMCNKCCATLY